MSRRLLLLGGAVALTIAGCATVGPDYRVPDKAMLHDPRANGAFRAEATDALDGLRPVRDDWWRLYHDPTLDALVKQALAANAGLRAADANLRRAYAALDAARAEGGMSAKASASADRELISAESYLQTEKLPTYNVATGGVEVSYELDLFGKVRRGAEAASADAEATQAARDVVRVAVAAHVAESYIGICEAAHDMGVAERAVEIRQREADAAGRMREAGLGSKLDVTRAAAQVDLARAAVPPLAKRRESAEYALAALLGHAPGEIPEAARACPEAPKLAQPIPVGDGMALLRRRPDVREAERKLAAATARIGVATADLYPSVALGAGAGSNGLLADSGKAPARYWSIGPLISWTLPSRSAKARVRLARRGAELALAEFDETVLQALKETQTALASYARALDRAEALRRALADATAAAEQARDLYRAGRSPYLDVLDAERTRVTAEAELAEAESAVSETQVGLFLALGGGWQDEVM